MAERGNLSGEGLVLPVFGRSALVCDRLFMAGFCPTRTAVPDPKRHWWCPAKEDRCAFAYRRAVVGGTNEAGDG